MMFFKKQRDLQTPMDHFLHRDELSDDERAILDVYMTGVSHALGAVNSVRTTNGYDPVFTPPKAHALSAQALEHLVDELLTQRPDMRSQPLGLCAVVALLQKCPP